MYKQFIRIVLIVFFLVSFVSLVDAAQSAAPVQIPPDPAISIKPAHKPYPHAGSKTKIAVQKPKAPNRLIIPAIGVNSEILEGASVKTLNKGIWHVPGTSNPMQGGNTVISAHRYMWKPPSPKTFWDLDTLKQGDTVTIIWNDKTYSYIVRGTEIVKPHRVDILKDTKNPQLVLFTCTPRFTSKYRLIVYADPVA